VTMVTSRLVFKMVMAVVESISRPPLLLLTDFVPELAIKTPVVDYNEEAQQLLMRTRRRGMLA